MSPRQLRYQRVHIRRLHYGEQAPLRTVFAGLSDLSRQRRYFTTNPELPQALIERLCAVDHRQHWAVGAFDGANPIGIARLVTIRPGTAELGCEVADEWQRRHIGTRLVRAVLADAHDGGITRVEAHAYGNNHAVVGLLRRVFGDSLHLVYDTDGEMTAHAA